MTISLPSAIVPIYRKEIALPVQTSRGLDKSINRYALITPAKAARKMQIIQKRRDNHFANTVKSRLAVFPMLGHRLLVNHLIPNTVRGSDVTTAARGTK